METNPNRVSLSLLIATDIAVPLHTLAIRYPAYAVANAFFLFTPSFIRFFALFRGVFQCFQMHIRSLYRMLWSNVIHTFFILPIRKWFIQPLISSFSFAILYSLLTPQLRLVSFFILALNLATDFACGFALYCFAWRSK